MAPPVFWRTSTIKDAFIKGLGKNPQCPSLSEVSDIIDQFAKTGYIWGNFRDHHESFADFRYLKSFSEPGPNIIKKYLAESPGKTYFFFFLVFASSAFNVTFI